jgi:hypothetical protein
MAFDQQTFAPVAPNSTLGPRFWTYKTDDSLEDVLLPGYFIKKRYQLEQGDFIWVNTLDDTRVLGYVDHETSPIIIAPKPPIEELVAYSFITQEPAGLDTPLQLLFGAPQSNAAISLDADGLITILETGYYDVSITVDIGRAGSSGGIASIFLAGFVDGVLVQNPISTRVDSPANVIAQQYRLAGNVTAGETIHFEIYRDSIGVDEGGLYPEVSTIGWGTSPSSSLRILRLL